MLQHHKKSPNPCLIFPPWAIRLNRNIFLHVRKGYKKVYENDEGWSKLTIIDDLNKKPYWQELKQILKNEGISKLYHFTDRDNLESIIKNGGLFSWKDCLEKGITIAKPGGDDISRSLDLRDGLEYYVRLSFVPDHPMKFVAKKERRISIPVVLEIDIEPALWEDSLYADRNMTKNGAHVGGTLDDLKAVHFDLFHGRKYRDMDEKDQMYYKAEILVKHFIPLKYITNIGNFGIPIPT